MFYFLSVLFIIKYRVYPSEQIKLYIYNELQYEVTTIQKKSLSAPTKPKNNSKNHLQQNTNPSISTPKPKNTSNPPNPQ